MALLWKPLFENFRVFKGIVHSNLRPVRYFENILKNIEAQNAHIKEHRRSQNISIMTSAIYQDQCKLLPALGHAFLGR